MSASPNRPGRQPRRARTSTSRVASGSRQRYGPHDRAPAVLLRSPGPGRARREARLGGKTFALSLDSGRAPYLLRPIDIDDYLALVFNAITSWKNCTGTAVRPDRIESVESVRLTAGLPFPLCRLLYAVASLACRETIMSGDELRGCHGTCWT